MANPVSNVEQTWITKYDHLNCIVKTSEVTELFSRLCNSPIVYSHTAETESSISVVMSKY